MGVKRIESFKQSKDSNFYDDSVRYHNQKHRYISNLEVGKTIISEKFPSNMDGFWFSVNEGGIINSFDFVSVENLCNTRTIGIVKELQAIQADNLGLMGKAQQKDIIVAKVAVMGNTGAKLDGMKGDTSISIPIRIDKSVNLANVEELVFALGIPQMEAPIPIGVIEMPNGIKVPISLAISYLAGPDAAHVNASGVSGNLKTSYLLFLLQSMSQKLASDDAVSMIIFNTREEDLLHIHEKQENVSERDIELFKLLQLDAKPFDNVSYFLPRGRDGKPLSIYIPNNSRTYSYELQDIYDRLELLFSETYDPRYNLSAIIDFIYESWPLSNASGKIVENWSDLVGYRDYPQEIITHKSTLLHFLGQLQRFRKSTMFTDKKLTSTYLGKEISKIRAGDILVIDIAMIPTLEEQSFVVADVMKNIDQLYSVRYNLDDVSYGDDGSDSRIKGKDEKRATRDQLISLSL
jgi:uncharacterized protein